MTETHMTSPTSQTSLASVARNGRSLAVVPPHAALVVLADPRSPTAEAYRTLAANLQFYQRPGFEGRLQAIGISSPTAGDGKSSMLANLAVALAEGGRSVIAIDADLRRPSLHTFFGVDPKVGLSDVLLGDQAQVVLHDTAAPGVRLLPAGSAPPNPLDALGSRRFDQVLAQARAQADFVLVDTAPAAALADAAVLAPRLDGLVLVVSAGRTRRDLARRAREQLERVNATLLGVVLTDVRGDEKLYAY
jgi:non-specific protein-tyrosine kinase